MNWRIVDSDLSEPTFTAAADEAIARARSEDSVPNTLHFYQRKYPTVSIGYFQEAEKAVNMEFCINNGIRLLRRVTGGSAVYTDPGHLIYGLIVDETALPGDRNQTYQMVCSAIVLALDSIGVEAVVRPVNDVLVNGRKISGSAQMRRWGIVLQHGTLVINNNPAMMLGALRMDMEKVRGRGLEPETYVTSLAEVMGCVPEIKVVKSALIKGFEAIFNINFKESKLTRFETDLIRELIDNKYGRDYWNLKR